MAAAATGKVRSKDSRSRQSAKPYPGFPLFLHSSGQWAKKVNGKTRYFGADPTEAIKRYQAERDDLFAGRTPRTRVAAATVADVCNAFLESKRLLIDSGELSPRTWRDYFETSERLVANLGRATAVDQLRSIDFDSLRAKLAVGHGPVWLGNEVQRVRTIFKFAFEAALVDVPVRFGVAFKRPSRKVIRRARREAGPRMIEAMDLRKLIDVAGQPLRAMILLGINCGYGQTDVAALPGSAVDLAGGWIEFPRPKTEIMRRCPLWPETVAAIEQAIAERPDPKDAAADGDLVFVTKYGNRWVRSKGRDGGTAVQIDGVQQEFQKLLTACGINRAGLGFYALRHTFQTIAEQGRDFPAVGNLMGHVDESMAGKYRERIDDDRLAAVVGIVRAWLWPEGEAAK